MPAALDDIIELAWYRYNAAYSQGTLLHNGLELTAGYIYDNNWPNAQTALSYAADRALNFREYMTTRYSSQNYYVIDAMQWISDNWPAAAEITMNDIIYAMLTATPYEVNYFVGLVDAFRQSIWNKPYNQEFFAALGRGFM